MRCNDDEDEDEDDDEYAVDVNDDGERRRCTIIPLKRNEKNGRKIYPRNR